MIGNIWKSMGGWKSLRRTIRPAQQHADKLQRLELLRVTPIKGQKMQEVVRDDLAIDIVLRSALLQDP